MQNRYAHLGHEEDHCVKSAEVIGGNFFSLLSCVDNFLLLNERHRFVHYPKFIVVLIKFTPFMKVLNLVEN